MDPFKEAQDFLRLLADYQNTLQLIQERVGPEMLALSQRFAAQAAPEDPNLQSRLAGFMLMGYLLHGHLERKDIEERMSE